MYDLHIHSNCSDGSDDWRTILQKAESAGLKCISITDHDNCNVYSQIESPEIYFSGKIITGIEMSAYFEGLSVELLGYGFNVTKMQECLKGLYLPFEEINQEELKRLYERCLLLGMEFGHGTIEKYDKDRYFYGTIYLHYEMRKFEKNRKLVPDIESWEHENIFFRRHTSNPNSLFYIDESDLIPSPERVIDIIHTTGGKAFIPHVYQYEENSDMVLNRLVEACDIDGIECYYPSYSQAQTEYLLNFCQKRNLLVSGGSDYHGTNRPEIELGSMNFILERTDIYE